MLKRFLLILMLPFIVYTAEAQEYWNGTKSETSTISRSGQTRLGVLNFRSSGTGTTTVIEHTATTGDLYIRSITSPTNGDVGNLILNDAGGYVGIGTAKPHALLHIAGVNAQNVPSGALVLSRYWLDDNNTRASAIFHYYDVANEKLAFAVAGVGGTYTNPVSLSQTKMVIQSNGNVGIGTLTPEEKLSVNGVVKATEMKVTSAAADWPDYVFDKNYQLKSAEELARQIKKEGHLPDMPSAETLQKEGIDVGNLLKLQQKKIEELTLYMIEQQKQLKQLTNLIEKVQKAYTHENE